MYNKDSISHIISKRLTKSDINNLVEIGLQSHELFDEFINVIKTETGHKVFMASWVLQYAAIRKPEWFYPHLNDIINRLKEIPNESMARAIVRIIWKTNIPANKSGIVVQSCIEWLESKQSSIAVKAFSCHVLSKLIEKEPELCREIKHIVESILPYASSGLANSCNKLLTKIYRMGY